MERSDDMKPINVRFCGFGGQGIVLSAITLGTAVVTRGGLYAVQTQSYGSEARGGQCQAELIIADQPINSPHSEKKDLLIALSQSALDRYLSSLDSEGTLLVDPMLVTDTHNTQIKTIEVAATETAVQLGNRITANMVLLGFLIASTKLVTRDDLVAVVRDLVKEKYIEVNIKAIDAGISLAKGLELEV